MENIGDLVRRAVASTAEDADSLAAFGELVKRFQDMAVGYAYSILGDFHLAEDAAQDAFVTAFRRLGSLREPNAFAPWLRRLVRTACSRLTRRKGITSEPLPTASIASAVDGPAQTAERTEMRHRVLDAIGALSAPQREVTTLYYINGYSQNDIAGFLQVPVSTVKSRLHASRKRLKERMLKMVEETLRDNAPDQVFTRKVLENLPPGRCPANSFAQGLHMVLQYSGAEPDYDTIMGDTGQAFIIQSEEGGPLIDGAVDVGWWPMAGWGLKMRLEFLGQTVGREVREIKGNVDAYRADPAAHYRTYFEAAVKASIASGRPVLAERGLWFVVAGYDEGEPPLLGDCSLSDERMKMRRIEGHPWSLIVLGERKDHIDRKRADLDTLGHAVALGRDALQLTLPLFTAEWEKTTRSCFTGQRSFALWAEALRDMERLGQARWHANMCLHLRINRRSAIPYLREMAGRHSAKTAEHLAAAADIYEEELRELHKADTSKAAMMCEEGRERLAQLVERLAKLENQAITQIEKALHAMEAD